MTKNSPSQPCIGSPLYPPDTGSESCPPYSNSPHSGRRASGRTRHDPRSRPPSVHLHRIPAGSRSDDCPRDSYIWHRVRRHSDTSTRPHPGNPPDTDCCPQSPRGTSTCSCPACWCTRRWVRSSPGCGTHRHPCRALRRRPHSRPCTCKGSAPADCSTRRSPRIALLSRDLGIRQRLRGKKSERFVINRMCHATNDK